METIEIKDQKPRLKDQKWMIQNNMIAIVDYGMGNLASVYKAMLYIGQEAVVTSASKDLLKADAVILPGVGAMSNAMANLKAAGLDDGLYETVRRQKPLLGICLGMQMLFETSDEGRIHADPEKGQPEVPVLGLGIFKGSVLRLPNLPSIKIPHMGWNQLVETKGGLLREGSFVYFVHSYCAVPADASLITSKADHGIRFAASVARDGVCAMQFHPEKSGDTGLDILRAWVRSF